MLEIDHYAYQSRWRKLSPMFKALVFFILLVLALCSSWLIQIAILIVLAPLSCYVTRISFSKYCKWMMVPFAFLLVSLLGILLSFSWNTAQMLASFQVGSLHVGVSAKSIIVARQTFFRSLSCLAVTYLFVLTTPFDQLIQIGKKLHLPNILLEIILLTYRFIFIFLDEVVAIKRSQTLRFGYISLKTSYKSLGMLIIMLFSRVISRYDQMNIALQTKLFKGDFHL